MQRADLLDGRSHPEVGGREAHEGTLTGESSREQPSAGLDRLTADELAALRRVNRAYRERFGFPMIVCVREHTKESILAWGTARLEHSPEEEIEIARRDRQDRAAAPGRSPFGGGILSGITTHVLDTARGRPAAGVSVVLERAVDAAWQPVGQGTTDADGRARDLLSSPLQDGCYRLTFDTGAYFGAYGEAGFYPEVSVTFVVADGQEHYHVPLLLSPFGYSTYRGS